MRAGLSTIQQTLTPEAASVLNHSIAEAGRRNHSQTTPLHVAATLLASPSCFLRQACIKSHPNSSHPLQCRALELCFRVALDRLPTSQNMSPGTEPPMSHALMAALKRAQSHQRRGCPEQQQQPLLAVKVELEQLIISILDDPSVSRVMREASFSSPAIKATIEQSLNSVSSPAVNSNSAGLGFRSTAVTPPSMGPNRNLYMNPRLQQQGSVAQPGQQRDDEVKRVIDILSRTKKRNPILVGESEPGVVVKEVLKRIENRELGDGVLSHVGVVHLEKEFPSDKLHISARIKELGDMIESKMENLSCKGVVVNLGDLKWLVEQPVGFGVGGLGTMQQQVVTEAGRATVVEMGKLLARYEESSPCRIWLIGTATCETYLRCQVYHPSMGNDWDLQAVPIAGRVHVQGMFPRLGTNNVLGGSLDSLSALKGFPETTMTPQTHASENTDPARRTNGCPQCLQNYEQELAVALKELEKSTSEVKAEVARPSLPQWMQIAQANNSDAKSLDQTQRKNQEMIVKKTQELQKKWQDVCLQLHPNFRQTNLNFGRINPTALSMTGLCGPNLLSNQPSQPKLQMKKSIGGTLQLNSNAMLNQSSARMMTQPGSPVRTELALGQTKSTDVNTELTQNDRIKDFLGCLPSEPQNRIQESKISKLLDTVDADSYKQLLKDLTDKVWWQMDAASALATAVTRCKLGSGKKRAGGTKSDIWLLFMGPDRIGKKKMAAALSEHVSGSNPVVISLGSQRRDGESDISVRGKTVLDRIATAVRRNPFAVILLEDFDEGDMLIRGSIKRAMDQGRLTDTHGREISIANVIFILTANWLPDNLKYLSKGIAFDEDKLASIATGGWQLRLTVTEKPAKRRANWLCDEDRPVKPRKDTGAALTFDLNEAANAEDDLGDGSHNSSDLTVDHEDDLVLDTRQSSIFPAVYRELLDGVDDAIAFKPVDFGPIRRNIISFISRRFCSVLGIGVTIEVQDSALEKLTSGLWLGQKVSEEWIEKVLVPCFHQLKELLPSTPSDDPIVVRLELDGDSDSRSSEEWLPNSARVIAVGL